MSDAPPRDPNAAASAAAPALDERARDVFRRVVEAYIQTGAPVGSKALAEGAGVSPATIRSVMARLAELGLLESPHTSAGRLPTAAGLRLFVDGFVEAGEPDRASRLEIERRLSGTDGTVDGLLAEASRVLSGLAGGAGLVASPSRDAPVRQVEFVPLSDTEALCILVTSGGDVENRLVTLPGPVPPGALAEAGNFLSAQMAGRTLGEAAAAVGAELNRRQGELDRRAAALVEAGLAVWAGAPPGGAKRLIVSGRANLLPDGAAGTGGADAAGEIERVRALFQEIERGEALLEVLDAARQGDGVRLFIGAENRLFSLSGSSLLVAPYIAGGQQVIGALGVIAPTRLDYARVIPMVDYTAQMVGRMLGGAAKE